MRNYRATILAGALVACILVAAFVFAAPGSARVGSAALEVRVHDGDGIVHRFSLSEDGEHVITSSLGTNVVLIKDGAVRMADADCPKRSCTNQAALTAPGGQIVCLPHKLWVEVTASESDGNSELDERLVTWSDGSEATDANAGFDTIAR